MFSICRFVNEDFPWGTDRDRLMSPPGLKPKRVISDSHLWWLSLSEAWKKWSGKLPTTGDHGVLKLMHSPKKIPPSFWIYCNLTTRCERKLIGQQGIVMKIGQASDMRHYQRLQTPIFKLIWTVAFGQTLGTRFWSLDNGFTGNLNRWHLSVFCQMKLTSAA